MRKALPILVRVVALGVLVALFAHFIDWHGVAAAFRRLSVATFAGCVAVEWVYYAIETWRIEHLAAGRYSYRDLWRSRLLTSFLTCFMPGTVGGEVARVFVLDRARPGNKLYLALLLLTNRLSGAISLAVMMLVGLAAYGAVMWPLAVAASAAIACAPLLLRIRALRGALVVGIRRLRAGVLRTLLATMFAAFAYFSRPRVWALAISTSLLTNATVVFQFWWLGRDLGVPLPLGLWLVCVGVSAFASILPLGFGSIGTQDASLVLVARATGHPLNPMVAASVAMHLVRISGALPGALYFGDWLRREQPRSVE